MAGHVTGGIQTATIRIEIDASNADERLSRLIREFSDRTVPNRQLSVQLYGWTLRNFQSGGRSQVPAWAPLAVSTLKQKQRKGYSSLPLIRTGHYRQSFRPFSDNNKAGVGSEVRYSIYHERGTSKMPARPALPSKDTAMRFAIQIYGRWVTGLTR